MTLHMEAPGKYLCQVKDRDKERIVLAEAAPTHSQGIRAKEVQDIFSWCFIPEERNPWLAGGIQHYLRQKHIKNRIVTHYHLF